MSSSDLLTQMRNAKKSAHVAFSNFAREFSKHDRDVAYCFFEGDEDKRYYGTRIFIKYSKKHKNYTCGGKGEVVKVISMINNSEIYKKYYNLFFIDKDFSNDITNNSLYVTPCYSFENFYTLEQTFIRILENEFNMEIDSKDFQKALELFNNNKNKFHDSLFVLNTWLSCQYDYKIKSHSINNLCINDTLKDYFNPNKNMFNSQMELNINLFNDLKNKDFLEETLFPSAFKITTEDFENKKELIKNSNKSYYYRGKFEIKFMIDFLKVFKEEANKKNSTFFEKKYNCKLIFNLESFASSLSQYAETPDCLSNFFEENFNKKIS